MIVGVAAFLALAGSGVWLLQRRLIYLPAGTVPALQAVLPGWEETSLPTADGLRLGAWFAAPEPGAPVVVVFNGNAGNRGGRAMLAARLVDRELGVLLFDYRGYGGNPGSPTEEGLARDARAAADFVVKRAPGHPVVYFGESLGAAVAVELAASRPPAALILRSPFTSLADVAAVHYPFLPVRALLWDRYPSLDRIPQVAAPVLVVAGDEDSIVPVDQSRRLFDGAAEPKEWLSISGADHNDVALLAGDALIDRVTRFIADYARR
jgi:fermentation-respiration switch protein FrsA (DUF1100 family)